MRSYPKAAHCSCASWHAHRADQDAQSCRIQSNFTSVGVVLPVELDIWMVYNVQGELSQYDSTFRRWDWAIDTVNQVYVQKTGLPPSTAQALEEASLRSQICDTAEIYCTDSDQQYSNYTDCMEFMQTVPLGKSYQLGFNTLGCRSLHIHMLPLRPSVHCPHIGPTGGEACYDKDYTETVTGNPFVGPPFMPAGLSTA